MFRNRFRNPRAPGYAQGGNSRSGCHQQGICVSMIASVKFDNRVPSSDPTRQANSTHRGFGTRINHAHHLNRRDRFNDHLGELDFKVNRGAKAGSSFQHRCNRLDYRRVSVSENQRSPRANIITVVIPVSVNDQTALCTIDENRIGAHRLAGAHRTVDATGY